MQTIHELKMDIIDLVSKMSDYSQLHQLYISAKGKIVDSTFDDKFNKGKVEIRENVTKDDIFAEQGKKSINFQQVQQKFEGIEWEHTLDEMLATLD